MAVNGQVYDWESITANFPHGPLVDFGSIEYSAEQEKSLAYGRGSKPRGFGRGKAKAEAKCSLKREEFQRLVDYARAQGVPILRLPPFPITVNYANEGDRTRTDILRGVTITKIANAGAEGDSEIKVDLDLLVVGGITFDGVDAY
ncbi:MAG: hypothetical protein ACOY94_19590 [Bacillota bacterium]